MITIQHDAEYIEVEGTLDINYLLSMVVNHKSIITGVTTYEHVYDHLKFDLHIPLYKKRGQEYTDFFLSLQSLLNETVQLNLGGILGWITNEGGKADFKVTQCFPYYINNTTKYDSLKMTFETEADFSFANYLIDMLGNYILDSEGNKIKNNF